MTLPLDVTPLIIFLLKHTAGGRDIDLKMQILHRSYQQSRKEDGWLIGRSNDSQ